MYCTTEHAYADEKCRSLTYERRWPDGPNMVPCSECGKLVNRPPSAMARSPHQFCSDEHQAAYTKKHGLGGFRALIQHRAGGRARQRWLGRWGGMAAGKLGGRPLGYTDEQARRCDEMLRRGASIRQAAATTGMTKRQVERRVAKVSPNPF